MKSVKDIARTAVNGYMFKVVAIMVTLLILASRTAKYVLRATKDVERRRFSMLSVWMYYIGINSSLLLSFYIVNKYFNKSPEIVEGFSTMFYIILFAAISLIFVAFITLMFEMLKKEDYKIIAKFLSLEEKDVASIYSEDSVLLNSSKKKLFNKMYGPHFMSILTEFIDIHINTILIIYLSLVVFLVRRLQ